MSFENDDRDKVVNALGGKKGLIDSGIPSIIFLVLQFPPSLWLHFVI